MPTAHTLLTVYNGALDMLSERPATSTDEARREVNWLNRNFQHYVRTALRQDNWNFARELHEIAKDGTGPDWRWLYSYSLPNGTLRVLPFTHYGWREGDPGLHEVSSDKILTDLASPLRVELIMDHQSPGTWDDLFANVIIARLAHGMAHALTHKASFVDLAKQTAAEAYNVAETVNAFEGSPPPVEQHDVIRVRGY